jgi:hypothetical protein
MVAGPLRHQSWRTQLRRFGMLFFAGGDDQFGLSEPGLEAVDFRFSFGKDVASRGIAAFQFFKNGTIFGDLLFVPRNFGIIGHAGSCLVASFQIERLAAFIRSMARPRIADRTMVGRESAPAWRRGAPDEGPHDR